MEKLLLWAIRLICYFVAFVCAGIGVVGATHHWPWPVIAVLVVLAVVAVIAGRKFGRPCPLVVLPPPKR